MIRAKKDDCPLCQSEALVVAGYRGVAFYPIGHPVESKEEWVPDESEADPDGGFYETVDEVESSRAVVVMVGDDRPHVVDLEDCTALPPEAYCDGCGQIGCGHGSAQA